jgi:hypothetical protein
VSAVLVAALRQLDPIFEELRRFVKSHADLADDEYARRYFSPPGFSLTNLARLSTV